MTNWLSLQRQRNNKLISQLWYKEVGLINNQQDQFLGDHLQLKNLNKESEGKYVCVERDHNGHQIAYTRELQIVQRPRFITDKLGGLKTGRAFEPITAYDCGEKGQDAP